MLLVCFVFAFVFLLPSMHIIHLREECRIGRSFVAFTFLPDKRSTGADDVVTHCPSFTFDINRICRPSLSNNKMYIQRTRVLAN